MKQLFRLFIFWGFILSACEEDPIIQTPGFKTQPVVFCIIGSEDSAHDIRVSRFFSGFSVPAVSAGIPDSIYFKRAEVQVTLARRSGKRTVVPAVYVEVPDKNPGPFTAEGYGVYRFVKGMSMGTDYPQGGLGYDSIYLSVNLPGLPEARCSTSLVVPPRIWWPLDASQFIYIYPDNPMRVLWSGDRWNEIDLTFEIFEMYPDSLITKTFKVQKTNDVHWNGKYYEIKVPYELIVQILDLNLKVQPLIIRRFFGSFRIDILTGNRDFEQYMKFQGGINDFNYNPFSNVVNGIGLLAGRCAVTKKGMYLDQASRLKFAIEPKLEKYRFIEY